MGDAPDIETLRAEVTRLERVNAALMDRVERDMDLQGNSFSLFQAAIALESKVNERTLALQQALHALEKSHRELQVSNEAAQAASRAKSSFLASMSHELRTPMNGVVGMTEALLTTSLDDSQRRSAELIRSSALSLLQILNDILDFSKIEAGKLELEAAPFDLRAALQGALQLIRPALERKGIGLHVTWPGEFDGAVIGDSTRFVQVITNLVGNAVKFTETGRIAVRAISLEDRPDAHRMRFEVEDTGIGIRPEELSRLFQSFSQADSSITRRFGGSGLGLAIVRRLVELMGGRCGVRSEFGRGSCFWFTLQFPRPLQPGVTRGTTATVSGSSEATPARARLHKLRVLLVEDNAVNQEVARTLLDVLGCETRVVENGREAVRALTGAHDFDLVLMDCQMPVMDGFEATQRIRAQEARGADGRRTPIIALTANAMVGDREQCLAAGMDDFLSKPFRLQELAALLERWGEARQRSAAPGEPHRHHAIVAPG